ncbi:hypothetical protein Tco_0285296 [Tanacetum coccineum]
MFSYGCHKGAFGYVVNSHKGVFGSVVNSHKGAFGFVVNSHKGAFGSVVSSLKGAFVLLFSDPYILQHVDICDIYLIKGKTLNFVNMRNVMAFFVISISSDSSEESVGTSTTRVILFGTILTTIPPTTPTTDLPVIHDDTLLTPTISPTISTIPHVAPTIKYTSPFINTDSSDSDTLDSPLSQDPYETVVSRWRSRVVVRSSPQSSPIRQILPAPPGLPSKPAVLVLPGQPIPIGRLIVPSPMGVMPHQILWMIYRLLLLRGHLARCRSPNSFVPVVSPVRGALVPDIY